MEHKNIYHKLAKCGVSPKAMALFEAELKRIDNEYAEREKHFAETALHLMFSITASVMATTVWEKSAKKKLPKLIKDMWSLYKSVEMGVVDADDLDKTLQEYGGIRFEKGRIIVERGDWSDVR